MELTRRTFLAGFAGSAAAGLTGFAGAAAAAPTPSLLRTPSKWDMTTDVVIAGSGIAGMCAAAAAVDNAPRSWSLKRAKTTAALPSSTAASWRCRAAPSGSANTALRIRPRAFTLTLPTPKKPEYKKNNPALVKKYY